MIWHITYSVAGVLSLLATCFFAVMWLELRDQLPKFASGISAHRHNMQWHCRRFREGSEYANNLLNASGQQLKKYRKPKRRTIRP